MTMNHGSASKAEAGDDGKHTMTMNHGSASKAEAGDNKQKEVTNSLLQYFKSNDIKQISLNSEGGLDIEYEQNKVNNKANNSDKLTTITTKNLFSKEKNDKEIKEVMNYLLANQEQSLSQEKLNTLVNASSTSEQALRGDNNGLKIGLGVGGGAIIIGLFAYLAIRKNKVKKH